jgi:hypothetical protein
MEKYYDALGRSPIFGLFMPWRNLTRVNPLLWVFLTSLVLLIIGLNVSFLSVFAWIGGFLVAFYVAVALALFESLQG